jgi:uncharacterized protein
LPRLTPPIASLVETIVRSGFPALAPLSARLSRTQLDGYLDRIVDSEFAELGHRVRRPSLITAWLRAYAAATATTASYSALVDAATAGETDKPGRRTTDAYRDVLTRLWILDPLPGWLPSTHRLNRLGQAPKHHLADPALAARLMGVDASGLLRADTQRAAGAGGFLTGALFESLVALSVRVYAQAAEATVMLLRTKDADHEVDLIVEWRDGGVVAIEVKLGRSVDDRDVRHLVWLRDRLSDDLVDAVVINTGEHANRRRDGIAVVPASLLGP